MENEQNRFPPSCISTLEIDEKNIKAMVDEVEKFYSRVMDLLRTQKGYTKEVEVLHNVMSETFRDVEILKDTT